MSDARRKIAVGTRVHPLAVVEWDGTEGLRTSVAVGNLVSEHYL